MRILQVGYAQMRRFGDLHAGSEYKLYYGLIRNGHYVLHFSERDMASFLAPFKMRDLGKRKANRKLVETAKNFRPDMILLGHCDMITNETLLEIRQALPEVRITYRNLDPLFVPRNVEAIQSRTEILDSIFITTAGPKLDQFRGKRARIYYMPNPCDPSTDCFNVSKQTDFELDLFFCGNSEELSNRRTIVEFLRKALAEDPIRFKAFGYGEEPNLWGYAYDKMLGRAKMGLNLNRQEGDFLYSSDRIAQLMGNGILAFIQQDSQMQKLLGEDTAVYFADEKDLLEKIRYYQKDDQARRKTASKGYRHYWEHFSSDAVSRYIVERTMELPLSQEYLWQEY